MSAQRLARLLCANLAVLILAVGAWGASAAHSPVLVLAAVVPLLLPLRGLWRGSRHTAAWASLLTIPYMLFGLVEVIANPAARLIAAISLLTSFVLFTGLVTLARGPNVPRGRA